MTSATARVTGVGKEGCGAFDLLVPDAAFHHVYIERNCYYPIRDGDYIQMLSLQLRVERQSIWNLKLNSPKERLWDLGSGLLEQRFMMHAISTWSLVVFQDS